MLKIGEIYIPKKNNIHWPWLVQIKNIDKKDMSVVVQGIITKYIYTFSVKYFFTIFRKPTKLDILFYAYSKEIYQNDLS